MVRKYKRKTNRQQWEKREMIEAVNAIMEKGMSIRKATQKFNIPKSTLVRWLRKAKVDGIESCDFKIGRYKTVFTEEQEYNLKQYIKDMHLSLCELSSLELRRLAFQYAEMHNINHSFNKETRLAGQDWYANFMKRNRDNEQNPINSIFFEGLNNTYNIDKFFELLTDLQQFYKFPPNRIYNVNETGFISIPHLTSRIVTVQDKSGLSNDFITTMTCCSAAGDFIPPLMIFPADKQEPEFTYGCPPGTKIVCHPSGSLQREIFFPTWFHHFVDYAKPSNIDPILLLLNGRAIHVKNLEFIQKAKDLNIHILSIPVNSRRKLHPLELNFMAALAEHYLEEQDKWLQENKGQFIHLKNVSVIYGKAYTKAAAPSNAIEGFESTGIYPLSNPYVLPKTENEAEVNSVCMETIGNAVADDVASTSNSENKSLGLVIKGPSDINHTAVQDEELSFSLLGDLMSDENSEDTCSDASIEESKVPLEMMFVEVLPDINNAEMRT